MENKYLEKLAKKKEKHDWEPAIATGASDLAAGATTGVAGQMLAERFFKGKYSIPITSAIGATAAFTLADKIQRDREKRAAVGTVLGVTAGRLLAPKVAPKLGIFQKAKAKNLIAGLTGRHPTVSNTGAFATRTLAPKLGENLDEMQHFGSKLRSKLGTPGATSFANKRSIIKDMKSELGPKAYGEFKNAKKTLKPTDFRSTASKKTEAFRKAGVVPDVAGGFYVSGLERMVPTKTKNKFLEKTFGRADIAEAKMHVAPAFF